MQTEAFFTDIRAILLREIGLAKHSIHVAVAWFTDHTLFAALLARQRAGCRLPLKMSQSKVEVRQLVETRWELRS